MKLDIWLKQQTGCKRQSGGVVDQSCIVVTLLRFADFLAFSWDSDFSQICYHSLCDTIYYKNLSKFNQKY